MHIHLLHSTHTHARMHAAHMQTGSLYASIQASQQEMGMGVGVRLTAETKKFRNLVHGLRGIVWF